MQLGIASLERSRKCGRNLGDTFSRRKIRHDFSHKGERQLENIIGQ